MDSEHGQQHARAWFHDASAQLHLWLWPVCMTDWYDWSNRKPEKQQIHTRSCLMIGQTGNQENYKFKQRQMEADGLHPNISLDAQGQ